MARLGRLGRLGKVGKLGRSGGCGSWANLQPSVNPGMTQMVCSAVLTLVKRLNRMNNSIASTTLKRKEIRRPRL